MGVHGSAETEFRHQVEVTIEPFKGLLFGLFFLSVGIGLNLSLLAARPVEVLGLALALWWVKGAVLVLLARLMRFPVPVEIGAPMGLVIASIHERRDEYRRELNRPDALGGRLRRARDRR